MNHQLIIVGGGATHRQVPWFRKDSDYWGLIALAGIMKTCDQWFELHPWSVLGPKDRWRSRRLKPLYMIRRYAHLPHVRQFPMSVFRNHPGAPFTSSFTYQLALAYDLGYSSVRLYGLGDFLTGSARERTVEWAGLLYWIGCWRGWGSGRTLWLPPQDERMIDLPHYGFKYWREVKEVRKYLRALGREIRAMRLDGYKTERGFPKGAAQIASRL